MNITAGLQVSLALCGKRLECMRRFALSQIGVNHPPSRWLTPHFSVGRRAAQFVHTFSSWHLMLGPRMETSCRETEAMTCRTGSQQFVQKCSSSITGDHDGTSGLQMTRQIAAA